MARYYLDGNGNLTQKKKKSTYSVDATGNIVKNEDIAPVRSDRGKADLFGLDLFQKGAFDDGYQFGDVIGSILGTAGDAGLEIVKGAGGLIEGVADLIGYGGAAVADLFGADDYADRWRKNISKSQMDQLTKGADDFLEKYSVIGNSLDAVGQGVGQVGTLIATGGIAGTGAGATMLTTGLMGASGVGSGMSEAYQSGATDDEALTYGLISGAADAFTEMIFGGLGKGANALGYGKGLSSADDMLAKTISSKFKRTVAKNVAEFGIKAGAEGLEEVLAGTLQAAGKKATYMSEADFNDIIADENLFEQFIVGAMTSGIAQSGSVKTANKTGRDFITGLTQNEQTVVDRLYESEIAGKDLTKKEKQKIHDQILSKLDKGYISVDDIESALGGETYKAYKDALDSENALKDKLTASQKEYNELKSTHWREKTAEQFDRMAELETEIQNLKAQVKETTANSKLGDMKSQLGKEVRNLTKNDAKLQESYREIERRGQDFALDVEQYKGAAKITAQNLLKGGMNNTNRVHDVADFLTKISADKNIVFDVATAKKLAEAGLAVDGKQVNGVITKDGIVLNLESSAMLETTVGHEITHALEGTEHYEVLAQAIREYAELKGVYQSKYSSLESTYSKKDAKGNTVWIRDDVDIDSEVIADLVGEYLFTDADFINNLSVKHRNVFQKIYDEIKYLLKIATAGSEEARKLEEVKRAFDRAYRENTKNLTQEGKVNYSIHKPGIDTAETADYDSTKEAPAYKAYRPGNEVRDFDRNLWAEKKAEATRSYGLTQEETERLNDYVGGEVYNWNLALLGDLDNELTEQIQFFVDQATNALKKCPAFTGRTYRNLSFKTHSQYDAFLEKHTAGETVRLDTFASSSKDPNGYIVPGDYAVHMVIDGVFGRDIADTFGYPWQQEVVYLPGTTLRITAVKTANDGNPLIYAQEVTENGKDVETDYGRERKNPTGTDAEGQGRNAAGEGNDLGPVYRDGRMVGDGGAGNAREIQQSRYPAGYEGITGEDYSLADPNDIAPVDFQKSAKYLMVDKSNAQEDIAPMAEAEANAFQSEKTARMTDAEPPVEEEPKKLTRSELHKQIIGKMKHAFQAGGFDFDEVLKTAKNLSTFATVDNTPQRVMEKTLGTKEGKILSDLTVNKVAQNETEGIKWLNSITNRKNGLLAELSKQYNIKPGSKESAAAQMYAEGFYVDDNNDIIAYGDAELAKDFPDAQVQRNIRGLARDQRIRQFYDETLAMINASRTRNAYPEIPRLNNYFLHFRAMDDTFSKLGLPFNPNDIRAKDLPTDLNGVTADLKPGQPYFASAMHRKGKRTSFDLLGGLERYASSAKNQIYHIDDIQNFRALRNYLADNFGQAHGLENIDTMSEEEAQQRIEEVFNSHLSTFAKFLNEEANVLAGKTALIDRGLEGIIGRRGITFLDTLNKQVGSNMIGWNVSSALTNFDSVARAFAKTNKYDFLKAFTQYTSNKIGSAFGSQGDGFAENNPTIIRRNGADRFYRTPWQKAGDAGYMLMGAVDNISTELIVRAKYNELTRKGMSEQQAVVETDKWVSRLMGDRSLGQQPLLFNSKMLGLITKFQLEVRNNLDSMFYDTIQEAKVSNENIVNAKERNAKTAAKITSTLVQTAVATHLFGKAFEAVAGYNPSFDIVSVLATLFGFDDEEESEDTALDNMEQAFLELLEDLPYTSTLTGGRIPIGSALPIEQFITGKDQYGNEKSRVETIAEVAPYYLLPGGYGQIKKTTQGLGMFSDDLPIAGSYTDSGNLRFPVEDNFGNRMQAALFGQYASQNARDYFDNNRTALNKEKQIQEFIDVDIPIRDYWEYREGLSDQKTIEDKFDYIAGLDLPVSKKNILINNLVDREEAVDLEGYEDFSGYEEFDFATKNPGKYTVARAVGGYASYKAYAGAINNISADKDKNGKSITGSRKEKIIEYVNSLDADYGVKILLFKSAYPTDNTYNADILDYLNSRDDLTYDEIVTILTELDFTVDAKGNVYWN